MTQGNEDEICPDCTSCEECVRYVEISKDLLEIHDYSWPNYFTDHEFNYQTALRVKCVCLLMNSEAHAHPYTNGGESLENNSFDIVVDQRNKIIESMDEQKDRLKRLSDKILQENECVSWEEGDSCAEMLRDIQEMDDTIEEAKRKVDYIFSVLKRLLQ